MKLTTIASICAIGATLAFSIIIFFSSIMLGLRFLEGFSGHYPECSLAPSPQNSTHCRIEVAKPILACDYLGDVCQKILTQGCPYETYGGCPGFPKTSAQWIALGVFIILGGAGGSFGLTFHCIFRGRCCRSEHESWQKI